MSIKLSFFLNNFLEKYKIKNNNLKNSTGEIVLLHFNGWPATQFAQLLIASIFSKLEKKKIVVFSDNYFMLRNNIYEKFIFYVKWIFGNFFRLKNFGIYKNFKVKKFLSVNPSIKHHYKAKNFAKNFYSRRISKTKILKLKIYNILIGDILYDTFLHNFKKETICINDTLFKNFFEKFISLFFFWIDFFENNKVAVTMPTHATYSDGLPGRIAIHKKIKCLLVSSNKIYNLSKKFIYPQLECINFKKNFSKLKSKNKLIAKQKAKIGIKKRLIQGKLGDMIYLTKTAYGPFNKNQVILPSQKKKIVILAHSFSDAPHSRGQGIFADFYDWILFLFKLSKNSNYDWYVKCHPNFHEYNDNTIKIIKNLLKKYPNVKWIDPSTSHKQIICEGIDLGLTVDGSVGLEYPYFKTPVFNASKINTHINYKFNEHPKNIREYKKLILNLNSYKFKINISEILECYYMSNYYYNNNWLIYDFNEVINFIGGNYRDINISKRMFVYFEKKINEKKLSQIVSSFIKFYNNSEYIFNPMYSHKD